MGKVRGVMIHDQVVQCARSPSGWQLAEKGDVPGSRDSPDTALLTFVGGFVFLFPHAGSRDLDFYSRGYGSKQPFDRLRTPPGARAGSNAAEARSA